MNAAATSLGAPRRLLVLGGTGFVGSTLCSLAAAEGWAIDVPSRRADRGRHLGPLPRVRLIEADVFAPGTLERLLPGHDAVVQLIAVLHGDEARFERLHAELPRRLAQACTATGVRRVVQVSALGVAIDAPSRYLRSKARGEAVLREAGLDLTLLRPSVIFGAEDRFLNLFARLQALLPLVPLAGASARLQPVWVRDVAQAVIAVLCDPATVGRTYELAGPRVMTLAEIVRAAGAWAGIAGGRGRPVWPLPDALGRLQARLMELAPGEPLMSRDNLDSLTVPNLASGTLPGLSALGIDVADPAAIAPGYLGLRGPRSHLQAFRAHAGR